jgi:dTDP-4-amino-4,6-dideoxygalactose transaminase
MRRGITSGGGFYTKKCETYLEKATGVRKALLTSSCTDALEMVAILLNIGPGDEVILPSFTFVSTANAFVLRGGRPVFCDIRADTLNVDERELEHLISPRTKAIVPVHYAGVSCEMDTILEIAQRHGISVVEDNAQGLFAKYRGQHLGTFGCLGTQSFHEAKNIHCGAGGALFINDTEYVERSEIVSEKGTDRRRFLRGEIEKYGWVDVGSSYMLAEILAAFLYAQLEASERIQERRRSIWQYYYSHLQDWASEHDVKLPYVPKTCEPSYHMFYLVMPTVSQRNNLIQHLKSRSIVAASHYMPLHLSNMGLRFGSDKCPVAEETADRLLRLPLYNDMNEKDQEFVVRSIREFR